MLSFYKVLSFQSALAQSPPPSISKNNVKEQILAPLSAIRKHTRSPLLINCNIILIKFAIFIL